MESTTCLESMYGLTEISIPAGPTTCKLKVRVEVCIANANPLGGLVRFGSGPSCLRSSKWDWKYVYRFPINAYIGLISFWVLPFGCTA